MFKFRGNSRIIISVFLGSVLVGPVMVHAMEVSQIPEAKATAASCGDIGYNPPPPQSPWHDMGSCQKCKSAIDSEVNKANGTLSGAKAQDAAINAQTQAGTAADAANTASTQNDPEFKTGSVNSQGMKAAQDQATLARQVSAAMKDCSSKIKDACGGNLAGADSSAGQSSAQSCEQSGQQADGVAAEKAAKAQEMAKNGDQANKNAEGMKPPEMPQGGQGMAGNPAGNGGLDSGLSGPVLNSKIGGLQEAQKPKIDLPSGSDSQVPYGSNFNNTPIGASGIAAKSERGNGFSAGNSGNSAGTGNKTSVSTSAGGSGASMMGHAPASIRDANGNTMSAAAANGSGEYSSSGVGGSRSGGAKGGSILGLGTGDDLQALSANGADDPLKNALDEANKNTMAANSRKFSEDENIFKRVSSKIREVSVARTMQ